MSFVRINGVLLHYRLAGPQAAPVIVFANSLGTDLRIWDEVTAQLATRYRLLTYDKRGHGLSDAPPGDYKLDDHVADLAGLLDHLGIERAAFCGVSIGGLIAQGLALQQPARTERLVLCDTAPKFGDATLWNGRIAAIGTGGMAAIADAVMERWFSPDFFARQPDALAGWRNLFLRTDAAGYVSTCATLRDADLSADVSDIACPVLVIAGSADKSTPVDLVRSLAEAIPGARFEVIDGAGHIPSIEQPEALAGLIAKFLEEARHG
jgi:3-oxoadipate enol-lactonase